MRAFHAHNAEIAINLYYFAFNFGTSRRIQVWTYGAYHNSGPRVYLQYIVAMSTQQTRQLITDMR